MGALLVLGLTACAGEPFAYRHPGEIPEGPGVMTGEEGAYRVGGSRDEEQSERRGEEQPEPTSAQAEECECPETGELEAYREFLRWKANAIGTPEYEEFQDWREWRQEQQ